jgi:hypothetical protein
MFSSLRFVTGLVLSPCCLPTKKQQKKAGVDYPARAKQAQVGPYEYWCRHLHEELAATAEEEGWAARMTVDECVVSKKNIFLECTKASRQGGGCEQKVEPDGAQAKGSQLEK